MKRLIEALQSIATAGKLGGLRDTARSALHKMVQDQLSDDDAIKASHAMVDGSQGTFAARLAEAYFAADATNRETLLRAFPEVYQHGYRESLWSDTQPESRNGNGG